MPKLPSFSRTEIVKVLERHGGVIVRKNGDHYLVEMPGGGTASIPEGEIRGGTLSSIIRSSGLSREDFLRKKGGK